MESGSSSLAHLLYSPTNWGSLFCLYLDQDADAHGSGYFSILPPSHLSGNASALVLLPCMWSCLSFFLPLALNYWHFSLCLFVKWSFWVFSKSTGRLEWNLQIIMKLMVRRTNCLSWKWWSSASLLLWRGKPWNQWSEWKKGYHSGIHLFDNIYVPGSDAAAGVQKWKRKRVSVLTEPISLWGWWTMGQQSNK